MDVRTRLISFGLVEPFELPASGEFRITCPSCGHHNKKCYVNAEGKGAHCFHCGFSKSWQGFMRLYEPPKPEEIAIENFVQKSQEALAANKDAMSYLLGRGLNEETIKKARIGYVPMNPNWEVQPADVSARLAYQDSGVWVLRGRITIPYFRDEFVVTVRGRAFDDDPSVQRKKYLGLGDSDALLYTTDVFDVKKPLFVCEGEMDTLALTQLGYQAAGVPGANVGDTFVDTLKKFQKVYLCYDGDEAGRKGATKMRHKLSEVYEVALPEEMDVSDYISNYGPESLAALIENSLFYVEGKLQQDDSLKSSISLWEDWAWSNGTLLGPKISWAPRLEQAISGWSKGLFLIGALPNSGKSCFFVKSAYECALDNPDDTIVVYLTLDDDQEDAMCRLVSLHTNISFEEIRSPRVTFDHPTDRARRNPQRLAYFQKKIEELKKVSNLVIRDARYGRSLQYIRTYAQMLRKRYPDKHLVLFIDSLAKVTAESEPEDIPINNWKAHLANELKYLSTIHDLCIVTPADFRKINDMRRPTNDDLKDAAELAYEANCVLLGFNEVNLKGIMDSTLKWTDEENHEWPILELNLSKNKKSMTRGEIRFKFYPPTSNFQELSAQEDAVLTLKVKEADATQRAARYRKNNNYNAQPIGTVTPDFQLARFG